VPVSEPMMKRTRVVPMIKRKCFIEPFLLLKQLPNGVRYPRVGGTRGRHFAGTNSQPRNLLKNAATPTRRVHAVLGVVI
jgi:hypothetical protein